MLLASKNRYSFIHQEKRGIISYYFCSDTTIQCQMVFSLFPPPSSCHWFPRQGTHQSKAEGQGMTRQSGLPLYVGVYSAWESKDREATGIQWAHIYLLLSGSQRDPPSHPPPSELLIAALQLQDTNKDLRGQEEARLSGCHKGNYSDYLKILINYKKKYLLS